MNSLDSAWHKSSMVNRIRDFKEQLSESLKEVELEARDSAQAMNLQSLAAGLELLQEQCELLENGRRCFDRLNL